MADVFSCTVHVADEYFLFDLFGRHSACVMQGRIFVFGGWDTPVCFNDMFMLDLGKYCENCYSFP